MDVQRIDDAGQTLASPMGKVLVIVDSLAEFDLLVAALQSAGYKRVEFLVGDDGIQLLERIQSFFFSDMEERVLKRHIDELKRGHAVVAIETPSSRVDDAARIAREGGARSPVHFGWVTVTVLP